MNSENPFQALSLETLEQLEAGIIKNFSRAWKYGKDKELIMIHDYSQQFPLYIELIKWVWEQGVEIYEKHNFRQEFTVGNIIWYFVDNQIKYKKEQISLMKMKEDSQEKIIKKVEFMQDIKEYTLQYKVDPEYGKLNIPPLTYDDIEVARGDADKFLNEYPQIQEIEIIMQHTFAYETVRRKE